MLEVIQIFCPVVIWPHDAGFICLIVGDLCLYECANKTSYHSGREHTPFRTLKLSRKYARLPDMFYKHHLISVCLYNNAMPAWHITGSISPDRSPVHLSKKIISATCNLMLGGNDAKGRCLLASEFSHTHLHSKLYTPSCTQRAIKVLFPFH